MCVTKNETYTAVFKKGPDVIITADAYWGGKVICNGEEVKPDADKYALDETLHLAAEPNPGFLFWGWYRNGLLVSTERECTLSAEESPISGKCTIVAAFKPLDVVCLPVASPAEGGTVTASRLFADRGSDVRLKATAAMCLRAGMWVMNWCQETPSSPARKGAAMFMLHASNSRILPLKRVLLLPMKRAPWLKTRPLEGLKALGLLARDDLLVLLLTPTKAMCSSDG